MRGIRRGILPGLYPTSKRFTTASKWDLLPGGHKAKGVSIFNRTWGDYTVGPNATWPASHHAELWRQWEWSNPSAGPGGAGNWIKPQIDQAQSALGCNYIRFFATAYGRDPASPYATPIADVAYFNQWQQLLDYCRSIGMYVYPTLEVDSDASAGRTWFSYSPNNAWRAQEWAHLGRLFQAYLDIIIGIDLMNEGYGWATTTSDTSFNNPGGNQFNSVIMYNALKAVLPTVPLTISTYFKAAPNQSNPWASNSGGQRLPVQGVLDYYDAHCYYDPAPGDFDVLYQAGIPVVIGEFGQDVGSGTPARQSRYNTVAAMNSRVSNVPPMPAPTTATTGGTVPAGTYQVIKTYVSASGETLGSQAGSVTTTGATSTITLASPPTVTGATGWYAYVTQANGATFTRQQAAGSPTAIGTALTLTAPPTSSGANPPSSDTSGLATRHSAGAAVWDMWDSDQQNANAAFRFGLADNKGNLRADVQTIFAGFPS